MTRQPVPLSGLLACTDDKERLDLTFIEDIEVIFYQRVLNAREQKGGKRTAGTLL